MEDEIKGTVCPIDNFEVEQKRFDCVGSKQCPELCSSCLNFSKD